MKTFEEIEQMLCRADDLDYQATILAAYGEVRLADVKREAACELREEAWAAFAKL